MDSESSVFEALGRGENWVSRTAPFEVESSDSTEIEPDPPVREIAFPTREQLAANQEYHKQRRLKFLRRGFCFGDYGKKKAATARFWG
jgi:hypothetical protein